MKKFFKILKLIIIAILIFLIFGVVLTKCANCKKENQTAVAYASEESIEPHVIVNRYSFDNSIFNLPYIRFNQSYQVKDGENGIVYLSFSNMPEILMTADIVINKFSDKCFFDSVIYFRDSEEHWFNALPPGESGYFTFDFRNKSVTSWEINIYLNDKSFTGNFDFDFTIYFYAGQYVPGYGQGLAAGLQQGKAEGAEIAKYGIFQNATVDAEFTFGSPEPPNSIKEIKENVSGLIPSYISNGINTYPIWSQYESINRNNSTYLLESANITINLIEPFSYSNNAAILISGPSVSLIDSIILTDINNLKYTADIVYNPSGPNFSKINEESIKTMGLIKSISIYFGRAYDTLNNVSIVQDNGNYVGGFTSGYNDGYNDGRFEGESAGYDKGYNKGFNEGESQGYANAVSEGVSQMGLFSAAVSFIKVFFQMTTEFLGTKIVGDITLGLLVVGLPAAFMIVNLAIGLAKKFLGGRGASEGGEE